MASKSKNQTGSPFIEKASGDREKFSQMKLRHSLRMTGAKDSQMKLRHSLRMTGAKEELVDRVMELLQQVIVPGITTRKLQRKAFQILNREASQFAARYNLRRAVMSLGPSGFPFEKLVASIFASQGYETEVGKISQGACISHEIDVIATRQNKRMMVECKYHNSYGKKCDVKVALYVYARSLDLKRNSKDKKSAFDKFWLATNTKFTLDAIQYGECAGLQLLGWDYPAKKGIRELISLYRLYPITCLTTLKVRDKKELLGKSVILCRDLLETPDILPSLRLKTAKIDRILQEIDNLSAMNTH
jgi:hypothetical protein